MSVRIKWRLAGFRELRTSPAVRADIQRRAEAIAQACGGEDEGFLALPSDPRNRARSAVLTATSKAARANAVDQRLLTNLPAGGGR